MDTAFQTFVQANCFKDLKLSLLEVGTDSARSRLGTGTPEFSILMQGSLTSLWVQNSLSTGFSGAIPETVVTALSKLHELESLTLFEANYSDSLMAILEGSDFPRLRYLHLNFKCLDKTIDFAKLAQLTVLRLSSMEAPGIRTVDLRSLTEIRALQISVETALEVHVGEHCTKLKWLHLIGDVEINGNVSRITNLLLRYVPSGKLGIVGKCLRLKELALVNVIF